MSDSNIVNLHEVRVRHVVAKLIQVVVEADISPEERRTAIAELRRRVEQLEQDGA